MAMESGFHAGLGFQPGGGINPGGVGREDLSTGGADGFAESSAAHISAIFAASADDAVAVDTAAAAVVAVDDVLGEMPRCCRSDFRFDDGADDGDEDDTVSFDTAAAVGVAADDVVAVVVVDAAV